MSNRTASIVSTILSLLLLVIFAILAIVFEMIALNGAGESQGVTAFGISMACLVAGAILLGLLAWKVTAILITKLSLNPILAITLTVALGMLVSGLIAFLSILIAIPLAGIR